jgi:hypothetical protein
MIQNCREDESRVPQEMKAILEASNETATRESLSLEIYNFLKDKYDQKFWMVLISKKDVEFHNYNTEHPFHTAVAKGKFAAAISTVQSLRDSEKISNDIMLRFVGPKNLCNDLRIARYRPRSLETRTVLNPCPPSVVFPDCGKDRLIIAYLNSNSFSGEYDREMNARVEVLCDLVTYVMLRK